LRTYSKSASDSQPRYVIPKDATVKQVGTLLADFRSGAEISRRSVPKQREMAVKERLGTRALEWARQLEGLDETHTLSKKFCIDLAWSLVAEDNDIELAKWLMEEGQAVLKRVKGRMSRSRFKQIYNEDDQLGRQVRRRHDLFAGAVDARLGLSVDKNANAALQLYCAVRGTAEKLHGLWAFPSAGAEVALRKYLENDFCVPCDSKLFDEFCDHIAKFGAGIREEDISHLALYHPVSPDPHSALKHWKKKLETFDLGLVKKSKNNMFGTVFMKIMYLLSLEGAAAELQWVQNFLRDQFPDVWHNRQAMIESFERDPKPQHLLHQQPIDGSQSKEIGRDDPPEPECDVRFGMLEARARHKK
jgi:hypothetical protein